MKDSISQIKEMIADTRANLVVLEQIIEEPTVASAIKSLDDGFEGMQKEA